jgi:hypothetical protein
MNLYTIMGISLVLCIFAFSIFNTNETAHIVLMLVYSSCASILLFLYCEYGNTLIDSSSGVLDGIYDCGWESFEDIRAKKMILMILLRCRKPAAITALGFLEMTREQFAGVSDDSFIDL